jgi:CRISPR system Cascade subunit CasC
MKNRFIQIHFLSSFPGSLLNRDDAGFAKRIPFGGVSRTRISSQCLKRHWRMHEGEYSLSSLGIPMSVRSRETFERFIIEPLSKEFPPEKVRMIAEILINTVFGKSAKAKKGKAEAETTASTLEKKQVMVLGRPEIEYLLNLTRSFCISMEDTKNSKEVENKINKELKNNLKSLGKACMGLDGALFGRMVTSDALARVNAAIHVAHAFTVHSESTENDYFSVVDDLVQLGSGHLNNTELTSGLYYGYVVVDIPLLISNIQGCDPETITKLIENLIQLIARVSPGAKLGSTAPYAYAHLVLAEIGNTQPCTFANAFLKPVKDHPDLLKNAYDALTSHIKDLDTMYSSKNKRGIVHMGQSENIGSIVNLQKFTGLAELANWTTECVRGDLC